MIERTCVKIVEGKTNGCNSIFMTCKRFKNFTWFDVPDDNFLIVTSWIESIFMNFKTKNPSSMSLVHLCLSSFNIVWSNDWITTSHKNKLFCNFHTFDRFFRSNKAFYYFIIFHIHGSNHFIPWSSKQQS